MEQQLGLHVE